MSYHGRVRRGVKNPNAVLTPALVARIRELAAADYSAAQIKTTLELTCSLMTIYRVINGESWTS